MSILQGDKISVKRLLIDRRRKIGYNKIGSDDIIKVRKTAVFKEYQAILFDNSSIGDKEENMATFICYEKCSTCRKAEKWLQDKGISYEKRPIREENPTAEELRV